MGSFDEQILTRVQRQGNAFKTMQDIAWGYLILIGRYGEGRDKPQHYSG